MSFLKKIQNKPRAEKMRIIWTIVIVVAVLLLVVWVITSQIAKKYSNAGGWFQNVNKDLSEEQKYYQKNLKDKGVEVPDRFQLKR